jgi:hypothetical protein
MKTYYQIVGTKTYRQLTAEEKAMVQARQTELVCQWQDATTNKQQEVIFDELFDSFKNLIKGMAYRKAENSYTVEQDDFEGMINLTLVETMLTFDRTLNKPFEPIFVMNINNAVKMMYRQKGYDLHDTTYSSDAYRLDSVMTNKEKITSDNTKATENFVAHTVDHSAEIEHSIAIDEILAGLFGVDEIKKTVVHMSLNGFKRSEIVSAISDGSKSTDTLKRQVNRTLNTFKERYAQLRTLNLV